MGTIRLLDCTLRDGGYLNDWCFGEDAIIDIARKLETTNVDILELGFMRNEPYQRDRAVFHATSEMKRLCGKRKEGLQYSVMCELLSPVPLEEIEPADPDGVDMIRMIVWKDKRISDGSYVDALHESYDYCKGLVEKGYKLCVQPVRVNQYSDDEFLAMLKLFAQLEPTAIYVVDSWGTDNPESLLHYMELADGFLPKKIALGYHGHNNMMHALSVAQDMLRRNFDRDIIIDASVYGIGRGAGNLNLEIIAKYMNEQYGKSYNLLPMFEVYDDYLKDIYQKEEWGFSLPFFLTACNKCNPKYARYLWDELRLPTDQIRAVLESLSDEAKIIFSKKEANDALEAYLSLKNAGKR